MSDKKQSKFIKNLKASIPKPIRDLLKEYLLNIKYRDLKRRNHSKLMVIGCGRSGTTYISKLFKSGAIDLEHEEMGEHGMVAWWLVSDLKRAPWGPSYYELKEFGMPIIHQVREPLSAISSIQTFNESSWNFLAGQIPIDMEKDSIVLKSMKYWYYWNKKAEERAQMTYKVEEIDKYFPVILKLGKFSKKVEDFPGVSKTTNSRKHSRKHVRLTWDDLEREDKSLTLKIRELGTSYGYNTN